MKPKASYMKRSIKLSDLYLPKRTERGIRCANTDDLNNQDEMKKFLERHKILKWTQEGIKNW